MVTSRDGDSAPIPSITLMLISDTFVFFGVHVAKPVVLFNLKPSGYLRILYSGFIVLSSEALNCIYTVLFISTLIEVFPAMVGDSFSTIFLSDCADASEVPDDSARAMSPVAR